MMSKAAVACSKFVSLLSINWHKNDNSLNNVKQISLFENLPSCSRYFKESYQTHYTKYVESFDNKILKSLKILYCCRSRNERLFHVGPLCLIFVSSNQYVNVRIKKKCLLSCARLQLRKRKRCVVFLTNKQQPSWSQSNKLKWNEQIKPSIKLEQTYQLQLKQSQSTYVSF